MIRLLNNCRYSSPSVSPKGWKGTAKDLLTKNWYIKYRFYDDNTGKSKQILIRANHLSDLKQRQEYIVESLAGIKEALEVNGYNPITKKSFSPFEGSSHTTGVTPHTPFVEALAYIWKSLKLAPSTMSDLETVISNVSKATSLLGLTYMNIGSITRKHLRLICDACAILKSGEFSNDKFNRHRTYLGILYSELMEFEAVEANIPLALKTKKKEAKRKKEVLTMAERKKLVAHLEQSSPRFLLFIQIFFHSGSRITEMLRVQVKDVDFKNQYVTYHIQKGKKYEYKSRPIKDIAVPFWRDAVKGGAPDDYVWSTSLLPGPVQTDRNVIRLRWSRLQEKLDIRKGFYSFKHANTTETSELLGTAAAALQNAESEDMITKVYDLKDQKRKDDKLKKINNPL